MSAATVIDQLIDAASRPYLPAHRFAYYFARGKLRHDPVFVQLLKHGLLLGRHQILDLGCGQGLLAAWLLAATRVAAAGQWPADWAAPPRPQRIRGVELLRADLQRAQQAFGGQAGFVGGDIREVEFGSADAVVILDVLHYIDTAAQLQVLRRVRQAIGRDGLLVLRVGDAAGGWPFRFSVAVDRTVMFLRDYRAQRIHTHSLQRWRQMLAECGFGSEVVPMNAGTPFANVLLLARGL